MPSESIHIFIKVCLNTFSENKKSEIYIIKKFIDLDYQVFGCSGENWHLSGLLCCSNKYIEKAINNKMAQWHNGTMAQGRKGTQGTKRYISAQRKRHKGKTSYFYFLKRCAITPLHLRAIAPLCLIPEFKTVMMIFIKSLYVI
jgi:hypothetical protein